MTSYVNHNGLAGLGARVGDGPYTRREEQARARVATPGSLGFVQSKPNRGCLGYPKEPLAYPLSSTLERRPFFQRSVYPMRSFGGIDGSRTSRG